jgi:hypothetical protein
VEENARRCNRIGDDHETVTLDLRNDDKLTGVISLKPIELKTVLAMRKYQWIKMAWNLIVAKSHETKLRAPVSTSWCASITGAFIGAYSHIVFDSLYHSDIKPLQPWSESNRLLGVINPDFMRNRGQANNSIRTILHQQALVA